jgi:hypothetical protein
MWRSAVVLTAGLCAGRAQDLPGFALQDGACTGDYEPIATLESCEAARAALAPGLQVAARSEQESIAVQREALGQESFANWQPVSGLTRQHI